MTSRALVRMASSRQRADWNHTAELLAMTNNVNCTKKSDMKSPADFHPDGKKKKKGIPLTADNIHMLKALVPPKHRKKKP